MQPTAHTVRWQRRTQATQASDSLGSATFGVEQLWKAPHEASCLMLLTSPPLKLRSGVHSLGSRGYSGYSRFETSTGSNSSAEVALGGLSGAGDVIMGVAGLLCVQRPRIGSGGVNKVFTACDRRVNEASIALRRDADIDRRRRRAKKHRGYVGSHGVFFSVQICVVS